MDSCLVEHGFSAIGKAHIWARMIAGSDSAILVGGQIRNGSVGDTVSRYNSWSTDESGITSTFERFKHIFDTVLIHWFRVFSNSDNIRKDTSGSRKIEPIDRRHFDLVCDSKESVPIYEIEDQPLVLRDDFQVDELISKHLSSALIGIGFTESGNNGHRRMWVRNRNPIYDIVLITRLCNNTHLGCKIYGWIEDFSDEKTGENIFDESFAMIGECVSGKSFDDFAVPELAELTAKDASDALESFRLKIFEDLQVRENIRTTEDFYASIPDLLDFKVILEFYGVLEKWEQAQSISK